MTRKREPLLSLEAMLPEPTLEWYRRFYQQQESRMRYPKPMRRVLDFLAYQHAAGQDFQQLSLQLLMAYCEDHQSRCSNRTTCDQYRSALRLWLRFLYRENQVLRAWHQEVPTRSRGVRLLRQSLSLEQVRQVLQAPDLEQPMGLLLRALLELAYGSAMRRGEMWALDLADVDLQQGLVHVRMSKNGEGRILPLTRPCQHYLTRYLREVRAQHCRARSMDAFFVGARGARLRYGKMLSQLLPSNRGALNFPFHLHLLRHSCATHLLQAGVDVATVRAFLGHRRLSSTQRYTHLTPHDLRKVHTRCHPRELVKS
jgi:site-specific recombinase XerD